MCCPWASTAPWNAYCAGLAMHPGAHIAGSNAPWRAYWACLRLHPSAARADTVALCRHVPGEGVAEDRELALGFYQAAARVAQQDQVRPPLL